MKRPQKWDMNGRPCDVAHEALPVRPIVWPFHTPNGITLALNSSNDFISSGVFIPYKKKNFLSQKVNKIRRTDWERITFKETIPRKKSRE